MRYKDTKDCEKKKRIGCTAAVREGGRDPLRLQSSSTFVSLK
jgi:hypothetical protein